MSAGRLSLVLARSSLISFARDIKLSHTIFALPFAASALLLIDLPLPSVRQLSLLFFCMVSARTFAMGANRFLDATVDAHNPRTASRAIPAGLLTRSQAAVWTSLAAAIFVISSFGLSPLAGLLSLPLLAVLALYSLLKHGTWICHFYLGFCLGMAPVGVSVALTGTVEPVILILAFAITTWTGGFDLLYAVQDMDFDRSMNLRSVPAVFGLSVARRVSQMAFAICILSLMIVGLLAELGAIYYIGVSVVAVLLIYEHWLVRDLSDDIGHVRLNKAFFEVNAYVSVAYFFFLGADVWLFQT